MQHQVDMTDRPLSFDPIIDEIASSCVLIRTRILSRVVTARYDEALQPFGITASQYALLILIGTLQPVSRSSMGRAHQQDRSTLTRNLKPIIAHGWAEELTVAGRARPLILTESGLAMILRCEPAWRKVQAAAIEAIGAEGRETLAKMASQLLAGR